MTCNDDYLGLLWLEECNPKPKAGPYEPDWASILDEDVCEFCDGRGKYVGFTTIEDPCKGCGGSGVAGGYAATGTIKY